jgi:hypothetical protein
MNKWDSLMQACEKAGFTFSETSDGILRIASQDGSSSVQVRMKKKWNTFFCDFGSNYIFGIRITMVNLVVYHMEKIAMNESAAMCVRVFAYSKQEFILNGFYEISEYTKIKKRIHLIKKEKNSYLFLKIFDIEVWDNLDLIAKQIKAVLKELSEKHPTIVFTPGTGYCYETIAYHYEGQAGDLWIDVQDNKITILESESQYIVEIASPNELGSSLGSILENIKNANRLKNMFQPPKFHFTACVSKYVTPDQKMQDEIYAILNKEWTSEEIESKLVKKVVKFAYKIPFYPGIQCVKLLDTYFVCRYSSEVKGFKTKAEAIELFKAWGAKEAAEDVDLLTRQM